MGRARRSRYPRPGGSTVLLKSLSLLTAALTILSEKSGLGTPETC